MAIRRRENNETVINNRQLQNGDDALPSVINGGYSNIHSGGVLSNEYP